MKKIILKKEQLDRIREIIPHGCRKDIINDLGVSNHYLNNVLSGNSMDIPLILKVLDWVGIRMQKEAQIQNYIDKILEILKSSEK